MMEDQTHGGRAWFVTSTCVIIPNVDYDQEVLEYREEEKRQQVRKISFGRWLLLHRHAQLSLPHSPPLTAPTFLLHANDASCHGGTWAGACMCVCEAAARQLVATANCCLTSITMQFDAKVLEVFEQLAHKGVIKALQVAPLR
jgi:hypothetical protein